MTEEERDTWLCQLCGYENPPEETLACQRCGYPPEDDL
jgi:ribosomal protein L37E